MIIWSFPFTLNAAVSSYSTASAVCFTTCLLTNTPPTGAFPIRRAAMFTSAPITTKSLRSIGPHTPQNTDPIDTPGRRTGGDMGREGGNKGGTKEVWTGEHRGTPMHTPMHDIRIQRMRNKANAETGETGRDPRCEREIHMNGRYNILGALYSTHTSYTHIDPVRSFTATLNATYRCDRTESSERPWFCSSPWRRARHEARPLPL